VTIASWWSYHGSNFTGFSECAGCDNVVQASTPTVYTALSWPTSRRRKASNKFNDQVGDVVVRTMSNSWPGHSKPRRLPVDGQHRRHHLYESIKWRPILAIFFVRGSPLLVRRTPTSVNCICRFDGVPLGGFASSYSRSDKRSITLAPRVLF
jgi:hypothetical protein